MHTSHCLACIHWPAKGRVKIRYITSYDKGAELLYYQVNENVSQTCQPSHFCQESPVFSSNSKLKIKISYYSWISPKKLSTVFFLQWLIQVTVPVPYHGHTNSYTVHRNYQSPLNTSLIKNDILMYKALNYQMILKFLILLT